MLFLTIIPFYYILVFFSPVSFIFIFPYQNIWDALERRKLGTVQQILGQFTSCLAARCIP